MSIDSIGRTPSIRSRLLLAVNLPFGGVGGDIPAVDHDKKEATVYRQCCRAGRKLWISHQSPLKIVSICNSLPDAIKSQILDLVNFAARPDSNN